MRRVVGDTLRVAIRKLPDFEERQKAGLGRGKTRYSYFETSLNGDTFVIVKSQQQIEELANLLRLEVFHVTLPPLPGARSPRGGGGGGMTPADEYLVALAAMAGDLADSKTLRMFLTSNVAPAERGQMGKFWETDVRKRGWLAKKKGERAKLQRRYCVLKFGALYYFKTESDLNPAGSIRLDLVEVTLYHDADNRVGFTLQGGRKHNPRTFVTENQAECDRWIAEVRAINAAHEMCISVQGVLNVTVSEGRNLAAQNVYIQVLAESQQYTSNVAAKCAGNPTWPSHPASFQISSNRKFLYCLAWEQPNAALASPSCLGEVSIPIGDLAAINRGRFDTWVPICPQRFLQSATGELHIVVDYTFVADEKSREEQHRLVELNHQTVRLAIEWFSANSEAMQQEGLFRVPGRLLAIQDMWEAILRQGPAPEVLSGASTDDIGGLLKMCLRNVSVPLFPFECFEEVCGLNPEDKSFLPTIREIVARALSPSAQSLLGDLLVFLRAVASHEAVNKMSTANLAVVFGPALLREEEDSLELLYYLPKINACTKKLIETF